MKAFFYFILSDVCAVCFTGFLFGCVIVFIGVEMWEDQKSYVNGMTLCEINKLFFSQKPDLIENNCMNDQVKDTDLDKPLV